MKAATEVFNGGDPSFKEMLLGVSRESQDGTAMSRTFSMINNPDSPSEAVRNGKIKEDLRKRYQKEALQPIASYSMLNGTQLQIEGPYHEQDYSYSLVNACIHIKKVEQGIPLDPYLLLAA